MVLTQENLYKLKHIVEQKTPSAAIIDAGVAKFYLASPDPQTKEPSPDSFLRRMPDVSDQAWTDTNYCGVICLVYDRASNMLYFQLVNLSRGRSMFKYEIYFHLDYRNVADKLHCFEIDDCLLGFAFADIKESTSFYKSVKDSLKMYNDANRAIIPVLQKQKNQVMLSKLQVKKKTRAQKKKEAKEKKKRIDERKREKKEEIKRFKLEEKIRAKRAKAEKKQSKKKQSKGFSNFEAIKVEVDSFSHIPHKSVARNAHDGSLVQMGSVYSGFSTPQEMQEQASILLSPIPRTPHTPQVDIIMPGSGGAGATKGKFKKSTRSRTRSKNQLGSSVKRSNALKPSNPGLKTFERKQPIKLRAISDLEVEDLPPPVPVIRNLVPRDDSRPAEMSYNMDGTIDPNSLSIDMKRFLKQAGVKKKHLKNKKFSVILLKDLQQQDMIMELRKQEKYKDVPTDKLEKATEDKVEEYNEYCNKLDIYETKHGAQRNLDKWNEEAPAVPRRIRNERTSHLQKHNKDLRGATQSFQFKKLDPNSNMNSQQPSNPTLNSFYNRKVSEENIESPRPPPKIRISEQKVSKIDRSSGAPTTTTPPYDELALPPPPPLPTQSIQGLRQTYIPPPPMLPDVDLDLDEEEDEDSEVDLQPSYSKPKIDFLSDIRNKKFNAPVMQENLNFTMRRIKKKLSSTVKDDMLNNLRKKLAKRREELGVDEDSDDDCSEWTFDD